MLAEHLCPGEEKRVLETSPKSLGHVLGWAYAVKGPPWDGVSAQQRCHLIHGQD